MYYLVLRGLDTIEDDMTLPDEKKQPLLRKFHELTLTRGWTFTESGPDEADRQLLVEYNNVVDELYLLPPAYVLLAFHLPHTPEPFLLQLPRCNRRHHKEDGGRHG